MNKARKSIFLIMLSFSILTFQKSPILSSDDMLYESPFFRLRYGKGYVYIGTKEDYESVLNILNYNDVFVLDQRDGEDPDMKVIDSYKIKSFEDRRMILKIMKFYEDLYSSDWNRSIKTMEIEWEIHNLLYQMHVKEYRTKDVDFNNLDEEFYQRRILKKNK